MALTGGELDEGERGCWWSKWRWLFAARVDCSWEIEPGVALPDEEPVGCRNREMPSTGMLGSLVRVDS